MESSNSLPILSLIVFSVIVLVGFIITIIALVDIIRSDFKGDNDKIIWILLTLFLSPIGAILYFIMGRKQKVGR